MTDLLAARLQMAISLGFHIVFACIGMSMPFLMAVAHRSAIRAGRGIDDTLTRVWARGVAVFFAVGAVSGTALSFELGLLWPEFMRHAGPIIGLPFSLEGAAFFLEAVALGIFLYGRGRMPEKARFWAGLVVGITGVCSGAFVICANAWMNAPTGFEWNDGNPIHIDPYAAMFNEAALSQILHMMLASFEAVGFGVAGIHAALLLRRPGSALHKRALGIALWFAVPAALLQPLSGDFSAKDIARRQPLKLAAAEAHFETMNGAPLLIGGLPDVKTGEVHFGLEIPGMLSWLAFGDLDAEVKGLNDFPRDEWPPVPIVHFAFQTMVMLGGLLAFVGLLAVMLRRYRPAWFYSRTFLRLLVFCAPLGFVALEAGWVVTEVGRQPWIIYGILRTRDALTPMPGLIYPLLLFTFLYLSLSIIVTWTMVRRFRVLEGEQDRV